ncbi:MAG: ROK family protein [Acidobacteriota bacterium]|nr:ROK family protein [Blastocatellia bacterium]MDW8411545.1 ROK family protein [Acidobacteriota bacterium]
MDAYIGVDVGRTTRIAVVDASGRILSQRRINTVLTDGRSLVDQLIREVVALKNVSQQTVLAVGVGLPGLVDIDQQVQILPNLPDISAIDIRSELAAAVSLPVILDNDANAATYGEWKCGAAKNANNLVYISIGTGIGGGIVLGGKMQRGARGYAGEFGHMKVGLQELDCSCGSVGCLETVASGPNIVRRAREMIFESPTYMRSVLASKISKRLTCEDIVEAAMQGDELAMRVISSTANYLGTAIANVINLFNVELVVLGGPVMTTSTILLEYIREYLKQGSFPKLYDCCKLVAASLGDNAGVIGSAIMAQDRLSEQRMAARG